MGQLEKKWIRGRIFILVKAGVTLDNIKGDICTSVSLSCLPSILDNYVEFKFFKYCQLLLEKDVQDKIIPGMGTEELRNFAIQTFQARELAQLPVQIGQVLCFQRILEEGRILEENEKLDILERIKVKVAQCVNDRIAGAHSSSDDISRYLQYFREILVSVPSAFSNRESDIELGSSVLNSLAWKEYGKRESTIAKIYETEYNALYKKLKLLEGQLGKELLLRETLENSRNGILKELQSPLSWKVENLHGKLTLVVTKPVLLMSHCYSILEAELSSNSKIEEVHVIAQEVVYVNCNLENGIFHGKNIVIVSKRMECIVKNLVYDLSGVNGQNASSTRAPSGSSSSKDGTDGYDAYPGESGGNGVFISDKFVNLNFLSFKSNGGSGGKGQDGGNGANGENGQNGAEMSRSRLQQDFDSPSKTSGPDSARTRRKTIKNLMKEIVTFENRWFDHIDSSNGDLESATNLPMGSFGCFIRGFTENGLHIEFGDYFKNALAYITRQSYLLVKGAPGQLGTAGGIAGAGGCGGEGGHSGTLSLYSLSNSKGVSFTGLLKASKGSSGDDGRNGVGGARGTDGDCGRDVGYVDNMWWSETHFKGPGSLELATSSDSEDAAWCHYYDKYRYIRSCNRNPPQDRENQRESRQRRRMKVESRKKNAINVLQVVNQYSSQVKHSRLSVGNLEFENVLKEVVFYSRKLLERKKEGKVKTKVRMNKPAPGFKRRGAGRKRGRSLLNSCSPGGRKSEGEELTRLRLQALEQIGKVVTPSWENWTGTKISYEKMPTSTKSYNSGLNALFGSVNSLGYFEAPAGTRKNVIDKLKKEVPFQGKEKAVGFLVESMLAYFQDESESASGEKLPTLEKYCQEFKSNQENFPWEKLLSDKKAVAEYIEFLEDPSIPFLKSDISLVAEVYGFSLKIYMTSESTSVCTPLEVDFDDEESSLVDYHIAIDEHHEFSRMLPITTRDMSEVHRQMENIVGTVYSFQDEAAIQDYLSRGKFGVGSTPPLLKNFEPLEEIIAEISGSFGDSDEKLVVGTALHLWPPLLLQVFHDKWCQTSEKQLKIIRQVFSKVTQFAIQTDCSSLAPFLWTIAALPVESWILEICLLSLEDYFQGVKTGDMKIWRRRLLPFPESLISSVIHLLDSGTEFQKEDKTSFTKFLEMISSFELNDDMDFGSLSGVGKSQWGYQLKKLFIASKLEKLDNVGWNDTGNKKSQALYYLHSLFNEKAKLVSKLLFHLQQKLSQRSSSFDDVTYILSKFYGGQWDLSMESLHLLEKTSSLEAWVKLMKTKKIQNSGKVRSLEEIQSIISSDSNSTLTPEAIEKIVQLIESLSKFDLGHKITSSNFDSEMKPRLKNLFEKIGDKKLSQDNLLLQIEAVAVIDIVLGVKLGYNLRPTQKFAIICALYLGAQRKNLLSQISTGEGKTCVVLCVAIVRGLFGEKVDVVTSSSVLAQRDAKAYQEIYKLFGLSVSDVTGDCQDSRNKAYQSDIVYGEVTHFQRDYLLDRFYSQNIRGARAFGNVIVDEVDSMFLDKGNSVLYLSHQPPDLDSLEDLFVFIWTNVARAVNSGEGNPVQVHELVMSSIYSTIYVEDLLLFLGDEEVTPLWEWMVSQKLINSNGRLLGNWTCSRKVLIKLPQQYGKVRKQLSSLIEKKLEAPGRLKVMNYLKPFVEAHVYRWIKSAFQATQMTNGKEYVVDVERSKSALDKNPKVMILDLDTGVDLKESQWNEGLHQFLQLKHGVRLTLMSLKAVFISNISFFNKYQRVFGLTGTIGTESDRNFLKGTYKVDFLCVPLALPKRFVELEPLICEGVNSWKNNIFLETTTQVEFNRSVLIICGTVQEAEVLYDHFKRFNKSSKSVELYRRDYETFKVTEQGQTLSGKQVIIATNLAGRGTDIKLSPELKLAGGLHVILSYLPDNLRVEQQAFGRAARCGDPGTGRLIFIDDISDGGMKSVDAISLKIRRDDLEIGRVSDIHANYNSVILKEEGMFESFQKSFEQLSSSLETAYQKVEDFSKKKRSTGEVSGKESRELLEGSSVKEVKDLVLYSLLDDWAFWLDRYSTLLLSKEDADHFMFDKGLHKFETEENIVVQEFLKMSGKYEQVSLKYEEPGWLESFWNETKQAFGGRKEVQIEDVAVSLIHEPALLIKLAKCFISRKELSRAEYFLEKVIQNEENFSKGALYYKALCLLKQGKWGTSEFRRIVTLVRAKLEESRQRQCWNSSVVSEIEVVDNQRLVHGEGYKKQKENVMKLLDIFTSSIDSMVGSERVLAQDFGYVCNENAREHLFQHLLQEGALLQAEVCWKEDSSKVENLAEGFCLRKEVVAKILQYFSGEKFSRGVEKRLKLELDLPSRSGFWKEVQSCLENVQGFVVVNLVENGVGSSSGEKSTSEEKEVKKTNEFTNWLTGSEKRHFISKYGVDMGSSNPNLETVLKGAKADFMKEQKFIYLRKQGRLCFEQVGHLNMDKLKAVKLSKYDKLEIRDISMIPGFGNEDAIKVCEILKKARIINEDGHLLSTEWTIDKVNFGLEFEVYRSDILAVLHSRCRYKYEVLSILQQFEILSEELSVSLKGPTELKVSLPSRPCKDFIMAAIDLGFILGIRPNPAYFKKEGVGNFFSKVFQEPTSWIKWVGEKTGLSGSPATPYLTIQDIGNLFPLESNVVIRELYSELESHRWIKSGGDVILEIGDSGLSNLSEKFAYHQPEILSLAEWRREKVKKNLIGDALKTVYEAQGKLTTLENPDASMLSLEDKLEDNPNRGDFAEELHTFSLSSFDHVIDTIERKYTSKMIFSAIAVILLGLAQIAAGICLEFYTLGFGTFIAAGLFQEGIGDVIYGLMAFQSGHFSWQEWVDNKWRSIAITAVTMGIGAALSSGIKYSKFGQRLFGSWGSEMSGRAIKEGLKEAGKAGITRSILPVLLKSFGYKVLRGCAVAASCYAVSYAYDKALKRFVDHFSAKVFANTYEAVDNHKISGTLSSLVDKVGVAKAQEILEQCTARVMRRSQLEMEASQYLAQMLTPVLDGLKEATGKMSRAGAFTNGEAMLVMTLMKVASSLMTVLSVADALGKMKTSVGRHLTEVEKEVRAEMAGLQQIQGAVGSNSRGKEDLIYRFKEKTNVLMREKIGSVMQHTFIEPLMRLGCQKLLTSVGRGIRGKIVEYKEARILRKVEKLKFELESNPDAPEERKKDLHKQVVQLCAKSRDPKVIAYAVEFGGPLGVESVQALANKLGVRIVVESDNPNVPKEYGPQNGKNTGKTLHLKHSVTSDDPNDLGHWEAKSGEGQASSTSSGFKPDCLLDAVNAELKNISSEIPPVSRVDLANFMKVDGHFRDFVKSGVHHTYHALGGFGGAERKYDKLEVTDDQARQNIIEDLISRQKKLREDKQMVAPSVDSKREEQDKENVKRRKTKGKDRPGPIKEYATTQVDGKEVPVFQSGEVTPATIQDKQSRARKDAIQKTKDGSCREHDQAGHVGSRDWGTPTTTYNLFQQSGHVNMGVNRSIENTVVKFLETNKEGNPSVEYIINLEGVTSTNPRPTGHNFYFQFKLDGKLLENGGKRVYYVPNPPCPPGRKCNRGPG